MLASKPQAVKQKWSSLGDEVVAVAGSVQGFGQFVHLLLDVTQGMFLYQVPLEKLSLGRFEPCSQFCLLTRHDLMKQLLVTPQISWIVEVFTLSGFAAPTPWTDLVRSVIYVGH